MTSHQNFFNPDGRNANCELLLEKPLKVDELERVVEESNQKIYTIQNNSFPDQVKDLEVLNRELENKIQTQQDQSDKQAQILVRNNFK